MNALANRPARDRVGQTEVVVIGGPTASGKSEIALRIAREFGGAVINADSMQVYQELKIVTARPDDAALSAAPHRLYGILPARERCSAGRWRNMALDEIAAAGAAGRLPILVGGTGLYLKALLDGIAQIPDIPERAVQEVGVWLDGAGLEAGRARLRTVDPQTAGRLAAIDRQRLIRALSVFEHTGRPLSEWSRQSPEAPALRAFKVALLPPREALYPRIDARFAGMVDRGALDEVRRLEALGARPVAAGDEGGRRAADPGPSAGPDRPRHNDRAGPDRFAALRQTPVHLVPASISFAKCHICAIFGKYPRRIV